MKIPSISSENWGILILFGLQILSSIMVVTCKVLINSSSAPIHPLQIMFVRMLLTYGFSLVYMYSTKAVPDAPFGPPHLRSWLIVRGITGFCGITGLYFSLLYLSISDATAITFLVPLVTALLAWIILHEHYSLLEAICSVVSLFGVLLIAKPRFIFGGEIETDSQVESSSTVKRLLAIGLGFVNVIATACAYIILRKLGTDVHPLISVNYYSVCTAIASAILMVIIPSVSFVIPKDFWDWVLFVIIGVSGFFYQFGLTAGIQRVKASKAALLIYTQIIFAVFWDVLLYKHLPGYLSISGTMIIIVCTLIVARYKPKEPIDEENQPEGLFELESVDSNDSDK